MKRQPICPRCNTQKNVLRSGILRCPKCTRKWNREYYHKSARRRELQRRYAIEKKYGVTMEHIERLFDEQGQSCAICKKHWTACEKSKRSRYDAVYLQYIYVDHCHTTGKVRGLLCSKCNLAIGMLGEVLERFDAAKTYLMRHLAP
jgi:hypothetical protein